MLSDDENFSSGDLGHYKRDPVAPDGVRLVCPVALITGSREARTGRGPGGRGGVVWGVKVQPNVL